MGEFGQSMSRIWTVAYAPEFHLSPSLLPIEVEEPGKWHWDALSIILMTIHYHLDLQNKHSGGPNKTLRLQSKQNHIDLYYFIIKE